MTKKQDSTENIEADKQKTPAKKRKLYCLLFLVVHASTVLQLTTVYPVCVQVSVGVLTRPLLLPYCCCCAANIYYIYTIKLSTVVYTIAA